MSGPYLQLAVLASGAAAGMLVCRGSAVAAASAPRLPVPCAVAGYAAALFGLLLLATPLAAGGGYTALAALFYRCGALVFGGAHVVLPLLRDALVPAGWLSDDDFLAGYGLAQAVPGPLFTVAAYLGERAATPAPALASALAVVFIFLPGVLLATAGAALWGALVRHVALRAAIAGINAAVVGLVAAALYRPLWTTGVRDAVDVAIVTVGFLVLVARAPPLAVVILCTGCSALRLLAGG